MEDSVIGEIRRGPVRDLFDQSCIVTNYPGSANNWYWFFDNSDKRLFLDIYIYKYYKCILQIIYRAVGYYTHGTEYYDKLEDNIRRMAEKCSRLHGFLTMHSLGGGTGSGLGTAVLKLLADNYPTVDRYLYNKNISHSFKIFVHILLKITVLIFINFINFY